MKGKILDFYTDRGFGYIFGEDNLKYFFHISNVANPVEINKNYIVDFQVKDGAKGLSAIGINIQAPTFDGKDKLNNRNKSKTEKGKIIFYDDMEGIGFIRGNDAKKYSFKIEDTDIPIKIEKNVLVEFSINTNSDGEFIAKNIFIVDNTSKPVQNNKIIINDETIVTSDVLSYRLDMKHDDSKRPCYMDSTYEPDTYECHDDDYEGNSPSKEEIDECYCRKYANAMKYFDFNYHTKRVNFQTDSYFRDIKYYIEDSYVDYNIVINFKNGKSRNFYIGRNKSFADFDFNTLERMTTKYSPFSCQDMTIEIESWDAFPAYITENNKIYKYAQKIMKQLDELV